MNPAPLIPVIALLGPTAVGKSALALRLCAELDAELISCDSRQIYRGLDIGTAKPTPAERALTAHHLIDIRDPDQAYSAFDFSRDALAIIRRLWAGQKRVVVCGGSGMYYQSLSEGLGPSTGADQSIRCTLEARAAAGEAMAMFEELGRIDPRAAAQGHASNVRHTIRQLEIYYATGLPPTQIKATRQPPPDIVFYPIVLEMARPELYTRINKRVDAMVESGLWDEFVALRARNVHWSTAPGLNTVGYRELFEVETGQLGRAGAIELIKQNSRHYAKRQITWFAHQLPPIALRLAPEYPVIRSAVWSALGHHNI